ncbi:MAG: hypothetical protein CMC55_08525 [Flavobacteriaceae bacterium]|nr:hypothetical protein [Flavobacteriaceae bacterium]|tara:strand:+ start:310 stop:588 length:279 start_codon:yes stop_codon:yes gene_type:complete
MNIKIRKGSNEEWVFNLLRKQSDYNTNIANITPTESGNKDKFNKGYAILKLEGIAHRVSNGIYLINPNVLRPDGNNYNKVLEHWLAVTNKNH